MAMDKQIKLYLPKSFIRAYHYCALTIMESMRQFGATKIYLRPPTATEHLQQSKDTRNTIKVKQPHLSSSSR